MANLTIGGLTAAIAGDLVAGAQVELENAGATASLRMSLAQLRTGLLGTAYTATDDLTIRNISATTVTAALTGNATTATRLQTARLINGTAFDGTADITIASGAAAAGTLTGATLASNVLASSLTSVGVLSALSVTSASLAASAPVAITQTWNAPGVGMTAAKVNVTDTASAATSLLQDWQVGGVSKASFDKTGALRLGQSVVMTSGGATQGLMGTMANTPTLAQATAKEFAMCLGGGQMIVFHTDNPGSYIDLANYAGGNYRVFGTQVVAARKTGWAVATGTATRTVFDTATVTLAVLAEHVKALIDDLHGTAGHGLIGT